MSLTIKGLEEMAYGTAKAAGWHDRVGELITEDHAYFQLSGLTTVKLALTRVVEAIREPDKFDLQDELNSLHAHVTMLRRFGPSWVAKTQIPQVAAEIGRPVRGSLTEVLGWLHLLDSESDEAKEAAIKGDSENFAEELVADVLIRIGDDIGAINDTPGHFLGPIDPEAVIRAKNERNKQRGYRHGGKLA